MKFSCPIVLLLETVKSYIICSVLFFLSVENSHIFVCLAIFINCKYYMSHSFSQFPDLCLNFSTILSDILERKRLKCEILEYFFIKYIYKTKLIGTLFVKFYSTLVTVPNGFVLALLWCIPCIALSSVLMPYF